MLPGGRGAAGHRQLAAAARRSVSIAAVVESTFFGAERVVVCARVVGLKLLVFGLALGLFCQLRPSERELSLR